MQRLSLIGSSPPRAFLIDGATEQIVGPEPREADFRIKLDPAKLLGSAVARSTQTFGCLLIMEDARIPKPATPSWARTLSFFVAIMSAALLLLCLWRWARGRGHWDDLLPPLALFLLASPQAIRIEGLSKYVVQFLGLVIMILAIVMLSRSLGS